MNIKRYDLVGDMDGNCSLNEARMEESSDGVYVKYKDYAESRREFTAANATIHNLELQLAQVVAENVGLKAAAEFATADDMWIEQADGMLDYRYVDWYVDVLKTAMETPATDAYLAEVRAQGVDAAIEQLHKKFEGTGHIGVPVMVLESFAAQLRQGAEHE